MLESEEMKTRKLKNVEISSKYLASVQIHEGIHHEYGEFGRNENVKIANFKII